MKTINPYGWIYFLQNGDTNRVKIGFTSKENPNERRKELQTGSTTELKFMDIWPPIKGFKNQEKEFHIRLGKFKIMIDGAEEVFDISSTEARSIIESFRDLITRNSVDDTLPLLGFMERMADPYKKYDLQKYPIEQLEKPDDARWPWVVRFPQGPLLAQSLEQAEKLRLQTQYIYKYGHKAGVGIMCWLPEDVL